MTDPATLARIAQHLTENARKLREGYKMPQPPVKPMARLRPATKRRK